MSLWITSIVGIIVLGVLVDIIVPEGEVNKYVKAVFALVTILVIIAPLPRLIDANFDLGNLFGGGESGYIQTDSEFLNTIDIQIRAANQERAAQAFADVGVVGGIVVINYGQSARDIVSVVINLTFATYAGTREEIRERLEIAMAGRLRVGRGVVVVSD